MNNRIKKLLPFIAVALAGLLAGGAAATYIVTRTFNITANLVLQGDIQVYSDAQCTTVLSALNFSTIIIPGEVSRHMWLKNTGGAGLEITGYWTALPTGVLLNFLVDGVHHANNVYGVNAGQVCAIDVTLTVQATASPGALTVSMSFDANT